MRFKLGHRGRPADYRPGERIWIHKERFLLIPKKIAREVRWLEHGSWLEETWWGDYKHIDTMIWSDSDQGIKMAEQALVGK